MKHMKQSALLEGSNGKDLGAAPGQQPVRNEVPQPNNPWRTESCQQPCEPGAGPLLAELWDELTAPADTDVSLWTHPIAEGSSKPCRDPSPTETGW